jgi:hypothetical protein
LGSHDSELNCILLNLLLAEQLILWVSFHKAARF